VLLVEVPAKEALGELVHEDGLLLEELLPAHVAHQPRFSDATRHA
jgi:hypothetical protein